MSLPPFHTPPNSPQAGKLLVGPLRINLRRRTEAYVTVPGLGVDVFIEGACADAAWWLW